MDADPAQRNIFGVLHQQPTLAKGGIRLRQFGQQVIEILAGKRIHPAWIVPGGVSEPLTLEKRDAILAAIPEVQQIIMETLTWFKNVVGNYREEILTFANFPTLFMGLMNESGELEHYDGLLRLIDAEGNVVQSGFPAEDYAEYIGEDTEAWSYLKSPYYKPLGYPQGLYRVGPLARLNMASWCGTPCADEELRQFKHLSPQERLSSFHFHYARLIEILYGIEQIEALLNEPDILDKHVRAFASPNCYEGVGMAEAPRGTLLHHYWIDEQGLITRANLIIATGHNNLAMNRGILQVAKYFVRGERLTEGMLNRVEAVIRAFDPCLSCSTHAVGKMPLHIELQDAGGALLDQVQRP